MTSPGATAVSSTSVPMRNWARLTVTELPTFPPPAEGKGGGGGDDFEMGMIAQAVKNGIQASRKRAARRCIGSESNKVQTQCHGTQVLSPAAPWSCRRAAPLSGAFRRRSPADSAVGALAHRGAQLAATPPPPATLVPPARQCYSSVIRPVG